LTCCRKNGSFKKNKLIPAVRRLNASTGSGTKMGEFMASIIIGIVLLVFAIYSMMPPIAPFFVLNWGGAVLQFLKGAAPIFAIFIGIADLKDRAEAKKEAAKDGDTPKAE
jgi:hypothetical protein